MSEKSETKQQKTSFKILDVIELCEKVAYDHKAEHILRLDMTGQDFERRFLLFRFRIFAHG